MMPMPSAEFNQYSFQSYNLIDYMTAVENVLVAMSITERSCLKIAGQWLRCWTIWACRTKADRLVTRLSGGEQQRWPLPGLWLPMWIYSADEPTGNVDEARKQKLLKF